MNTTELLDTPPANLLNDEQVATLLGFSTAWVRKQRYLKRKGQPHVFMVAPVMIGNVPRYRQAEVMAWLNSL